MKRVLSFFAALAAGATLSLMSATSALALEGLASEGKSLGGLSDTQCLRKVDSVIAKERRANSRALRTVSGRFTRKMIFTDGSVDFVCFPDDVVVIVYFNNAGNAQAEKDVKRFLRAF